MIQNLKELRKEKGLTQKDVAEKLGISESTYSLIENDIVKISVNRAEELSRILDVSPMIFFENQLE